MPVAAQAQTFASCDFSGIWYEPEFAGEGYNIYSNSSGWMIYFLGFDNWGSNFWVVSELQEPGELKLGETLSLTMLITPEQEGGEFSHPLPPSLLEPWGTLDVSFDSCTSGEFTLAAADIWTFGRKISSVVKLMGPGAGDGN